MRRKLFSSTATEVTRRKLFSTPAQPTRRKLFSDDVESKLPPVNEEDKKIVKCMDCGQTYDYTGSDLHLICTKCGSDRFEFITNISDPDVIEPGDLNPIDKVFSEKRRKLFNDVSEVEANALNAPELETPTNSLTNNGDVSKLPYLHVCPDCGTEFHTEENYVDFCICPNCGGKRCRKMEIKDADGNSYDSCEDAVDSMFSDIESDELDELLARHKGKAVDAEDLAAEMYAMGIYDEVGGVEGLVENGYAEELREGQIQFSDVADTQRKMFSKLVISVTKEFDLDPITDRESVIDSLAERFPGKPIMILKRAQSTVAPEVTTFSDKSYLKDSGIESDLKLVYGGQVMTIKDFMNLLSEEYPDAPEDIIDLLESSKAIKVNGGKVIISK